MAAGGALPALLAEAAKRVSVHNACSAVLARTRHAAAAPRCGHNKNPVRRFLFIWSFSEVMSSVSLLTDAAGGALPAGGAQALEGVSLVEAGSSAVASRLVALKLGWESKKNTEDVKQHLEPLHGHQGGGGA